VLYSILSKLSKVVLLLSVVFLSKMSVAAITDGKFSINQIFDVQYYWSGNTLYASNFIAPYDKNFQTVTVTAGQYFQFFASTTQPGKYGLKLMNSDGTQARIIHDHGDITALSSGAIFYIGSGFFGNVISTAQGYNYGASATFTDMDRDVTSADLNNYTWASTTPLAAGETASSPPPPPPPPTPVYSSGITTQQQTRKTVNLNENPLGHNAQVNILGDDNIINIQQVGGRHFVSVDVQGNVNNVEILQTSTVNARHYMEAKVAGSNNDLILQQRDSSKTQFVEVLGTNNSVTTNQKGTGNHYLDVKITGDNHTAGIIQDGSGSHKATVHLDGSQPWNFNLNQNSSTGQTYSLPHGMSDGSAVSGTCFAIGGCNLTINQQ
jgi:hypothetical protein